MRDLSRQDADNAVLKAFDQRAAARVAALPVLAARRAARQAYHVVCAWCPKVLVQGALDAPVSHGICAACSEQLFPVRVLAGL